mmetsp:Transcript_20011/g.35715  ORF Transcript_20011/g.35715 Transcript_20011/m.35715 type:complete len:204 (+) Transcript_20011:144-755(+)
MSQILSVFRRLGSKYAAISNKSPYFTASISAGCILCAADITAQKLSGKSKWDKNRTLSLALFGVFYYGFPCKAIYLKYDRILGGNKPVLTMLIDTYFHTPLILIPSFYAFTGTIKGQDMEEWSNRLWNEWVTASFGSAAYWTPVQILCFRYVPQHSRIAFVACMSFFHKAWLSWLSNRKTPLEAPAPDAVPASAAVSVTEVAL